MSKNCQITHRNWSLDLGLGYLEGMVGSLSGRVRSPFMTLQTRALGPRETPAFCAAYTMVSGTVLSPEQIMGCRVFGFYQKDELCGGFVLRNDGAFRAVSAIMDLDARERHQKESEGCVEVTGLWIRPELKTLSGRIQGISSVLREAHRLGSNRILGITTKARLWEQTYSVLGAKKIYEGKTALEANKARDGIVFELAIEKIIVRVPRYLLVHLKKKHLRIGKVRRNSHHARNEVKGR